MTDPENSFFKNLCCVSESAIFIKEFGKTRIVINSFLHIFLKSLKEFAVILEKLEIAIDLDDSINSFIF
ncbi:hypothetical protein AOE58_01700 [Candidatus Riesia pthiripubis]|uniref:Uncharacterized protein n=1 Tax=Candidatus Riesia pthiripubis TaxID=428412 RepID=A0A1V0HP97_9ENTR|nr:hypothetical protein AOE58_01700 [Candidatus Riesia pthiripubis]